jgi:hypothetical protein
MFSLIFATKDGIIRESWNHRIAAFAHIEREAIWNLKWNDNRKEKEAEKKKDTKTYRERENDIQRER